MNYRKPFDQRLIDDLQATNTRIMTDWGAIWTPRGGVPAARTRGPHRWSVTMIALVVVLVAIAITGAVLLV